MNMDLKSKDGCSYTPAEMMAAIIVHGTIFLTKCVVFCWIFSRMIGGR